MISYALLVDVGLNVHVRGVIIKKVSRFKYYNDASFYIKKRFMKKYLCWYAHKKPYAPY